MPWSALHCISVAPMRQATKFFRRGVQMLQLRLAPGRKGLRKALGDVPSWVAFQDREKVEVCSYIFACIAPSRPSGLSLHALTLTLTASSRKEQPSSLQTRLVKARCSRHRAHQKGPRTACGGSFASRLTFMSAVAVDEPYGARDVAVL